MSPVDAALAWIAYTTAAGAAFLATAWLIDRALDLIDDQLRRRVRGHGRETSDRTAGAGSPVPPSAVRSIPARWR